MTEHNLASAGNPITRTLVYGLAALILYFLLYLLEDQVLAFTSQGGWYFITPVVIAFVFSYVHGTFTAHFWDVLGIKAKK